MHDRILAQNFARRALRASASAGISGDAAPVLRDKSAKSG
jgi:hypothetical protein